MPAGSGAGACVGLAGPIRPDSLGSCTDAGEVSAIKQIVVEVSLVRVLELRAVEPLQSHLEFWLANQPGAPAS